MAALALKIHSEVAAVVLVIVIAAAALFIQAAEAETHTVGGASGWTNTLHPDFYNGWAAKSTFKVGDILLFEFPSGGHDVATLTKEAFDACNNTDLLSLPESKGPASYSLNQSGDYYFICAFPGHCSQGQKLAIKVGTAAGADPPAHAPATSPSPPPLSYPSITPTPSDPTDITPPPSEVSAPPPSEANTPTPSEAKAPSEAETPSLPPPSKAGPTAAAAPAPQGSAASPLAATCFSTIFMTSIVINAIALLLL